METPFQFGTLATDDNFVDRVQERAELKQMLSSGINVALISPRRLRRKLKLLNLLVAVGLVAATWTVFMWFVLLKKSAAPADPAPPPYAEVTVYGRARTWT